MEKAGAAAIQIEDQVMPKRCGHLDGKEVVEPGGDGEEDHRARRRPPRGRLVIVARTDAAREEGLDGAVERARLYRRPERT